MPAISRLPANGAASRWPASDVASPKRSSIVPVTMLLAVFFGSTATFMPFASFDRTTRLSMLAVVGSNDFASRDRHVALVVAERRREIRRGGHDRAIRRRVRNVVADRAVRRLEVRLRDAHSPPGDDVLKPIVLQEHQPPVALRDGAVQRAGRDRLRIRQAVLEAAQRAGCVTRSTSSFVGGFFTMSSSAL